MTLDTDRPSVSVVVPFFNNERHISRCIESLLAQEDCRGTYEVILINNRSTDGSVAIVDRYSGLMVLEEPTPGAYSARNTGIRQARAPLIAFTDADCVVASDWLRSIQDGMQDPAVDILLGRCRYPTSASLGLKMLGAYEDSKTKYVIRRCPPAHHFGHANNMAVRASVFEEHGLFKEWRRAADTELIQRLGAKRPDSRPMYEPSMEITHLEFQRFRDRIRRLSLYTETNAKIDTFRELGPGHRLGVLWHMLRGR